MILIFQSASSICLLGALLFGGYALAHNVSPYRPPTGERASVFQTITTRWPWYKWLHLTLHPVAYHLEQHLKPAQIQRLNAKLKSAGTPLGLNASEFMAGSALLAVVAGIGGGICSSVTFGQIIPGVFMGMLCGVAVPFARLDASITLRKQQILHALPGAIDLIALCMRAGQHFQGALDAVASQMPRRHPLRTEFELMSSNIALGASRQEALRTLENRVNAAETSRFVQCILRAEQKGSSLADIFSIQAEIMRTQRTQTAEQAASRAAVLMLGPLMLIFLAVFLLLLGPFIVKAYYGTLL